MKRIITIAVIFACACLSACGGTRSAHFTRFNTDVYVTVNGELTRETIEKIDSVLAGLEKEFSLNEKTSAVSRLNAAAANEEIKVSATFTEVLEAAKTACIATWGAFNPAVYPLTRLWKLSSDTFVSGDLNYIPPDAESVAALREHIDFASVSADRQNNTAVKNDGETKIDLGGIVKGYAADIIGNYLTELGYTGGYINIGGSSLKILSAEYLTVRHPRNASAADGILTISGETVENKSVSTSGDYERYYMSGGKRYCHIISPFTGAPVDTGVISATVIGPSATVADAISTALLALDETKAATLFRSDYAKEYLFFIVRHDGERKRILTNAPENSYTVNAGAYVTETL